MEDVAPSETGSLSDPGLGTPERGRAMFEHAVESCVKILRWFRGIGPYRDTGGPLSQKSDRRGS
jgi:hypothetical protein